MSVLPDNDPNGFRHPIVILALLLVISIIGLIGSAVVGIDQGVLSNMARREYARGLITFLFAVVTIGLALMLVVSALIGSGDELGERRFRYGKEVFSLLLGVFGTIVGYYFGATSSEGSSTPLRVSALEIVPETAAHGSTVRVRALIAGGVSPYHYSIAGAQESADQTAAVSDSDLISEEVTIPSAAPGKLLRLQLVVSDSRNQQVRVIGSVRIAPK
ncbi:MAG: hypothetical protein JO033_18435 [Acidobacteriaceae bacterium]|nr:hypothetical protein [Acidobacteriaceae bacterium]MBV9502552.1 hypothetical protein [Acidobacteriaceae bacterium]